MAILAKLDRRTFIRNAGLTALAGATGTVVPAAVAATPGSPSHMAGGKYDFDTPYSRIGTNCSRWDSPAKDYPPGQFKFGMGVASMDFPTPACITDAIAERCQHQVWGYLASTDSLRDAILQWNGQRFDLDLPPESLEIATGVYSGIIAAFRTLSPPGTKTLMVTPIYNGFRTMARHARVLVEESPMVYQNGRYEIDWADLESRMTADVHTMIVCNPQNPTGNVWSPDDLLRIGQMCLERNIVVLSDEIHADIVRPGVKYTPFASLPDRAVVDNSLTFGAVSKTFNLSGMKVAHFYSTNPVLLGRVRANHRIELNTLGMVATEAALRHGADWFDQARDYLYANHSFAEGYIKENMPLVRYNRAEGTYLAWLDVSRVQEAIGAAERAQAAGKPSADHYFRDWLVEQSGVYVNPGFSYGAGGEGHIRMNLASSRQVVKAAFDAMADAMRKV